MFVFSLGKFIEINTWLALLAPAIKTDWIAFPLLEHTRLIQETEFIHANLVEFDLLITALSAARLLDALRSGNEENNGIVKFSPQNTSLIKEQCQEISKRLKDELETKTFFALPANKIEYYNQGASLFGGDVANKFPTAIYEIDEATKCFALGRYTACVFHLMRILETGLTALSKALDLPSASNWNKDLNNIEKAIRERSVQTHGEAWKNDEPFFTEAATHFRMVKNAWRNHTMHLKRTYDEESAKAILNSTKDFMRHLATRLQD